MSGDEVMTESAAEPSISSVVLPAIELRRFSADAIEGVRNTLIDVYEDVYAQLDDPFHSVERFEDRLRRFHLVSPRWQCVVGTIDGNAVGFAYGFALAADNTWWDGLQSPVEPEAIRENGERTFAVSELMVTLPWRKRGVARAIHEELLAGRSETRATLLVDQEHPRVRALYESWGYRWFGKNQPFPDSPGFDSMIRPLQGGS